MSVHVDLKGAVLKGGAVCREVVAVVTDKVRLDTRPYVPVLTGAMRGSADTLSDRGRGLLVYGGEAAAYVRPQYFKALNHPRGGTDHWFDAAKRDHAGDWERVAKEAAGKIAHV